MKKSLHAIIATALLTLAATASAAPKQVRIGVLNGPSGIPCASLMENSDSTGIKNLIFENCASVQTELPKLLKGELDIGFLPPNAAAKVFTAGDKALVCLGITGNGNLFLISKNKDYHSVESLRGKTVYCAGQGATPEFIFKHLLTKAGIPFDGSEGAVNLDFSIPNANLAAAVISDKAEYALVPEPFATVAESKNPQVKRVSDLQAVYASYMNGAQYPMTLLVANAKFAKANKSTVAKFIEAYKKASEWTVRNPAHAGALVEKHKLGLAANIAEKAIPSASYVWKPAAEAKKEIESLLTVFLENAPQSAGGKLPSEDFYFNPSSK